MIFAAVELAVNGVVLVVFGSSCDDEGNLIGSMKNLPSIDCS